MVALTYIRKLARYLTQYFGDDGSAAAAGALVQRWGAELSVALQTATACQLQGSVGESHAEGAAALREAPACRALAPRASERVSC